MNTIAKLGLLAVGAALAAAVPARRAEAALGVETSDLGFQRADPSGWVHARVSRDLADGCEYRADIRGTIRDDAARTHADHFHAALAVRPSVHCPNVAAAYAPMRTVQIVGSDAHDLARALDRNGTVTAVHDRSRCTYAPRFVVGNGAIRSHDVRIACAVP